jgi:hypothetical protein
MYFNDLTNSNPVRQPLQEKNITDKNRFDPVWRWEAD